MIRSFRSNALDRYWTRGQENRIRLEWRRKVRLILSRMDAAEAAREMDLPGFGFHRLSGDKRERFVVWVSRNWRITFGWDGKDAIDVELEDYHGK